MQCVFWKWNDRTTSLSSTHCVYVRTRGTREKKRVQRALCQWFYGKTSNHCSIRSIHFVLLCCVYNGQPSPNITTSSLSRYERCSQCMTKEELLNSFACFVLQFIAKMVLKTTCKSEIKFISKYCRYLHLSTQ